MSNDPYSAWTKGDACQYFFLLNNSMKEWAQIIEVLAILLQDLQESSNSKI